jgi:hypothetical protein
LTCRVGKLKEDGQDAIKDPFFRTINAEKATIDWGPSQEYDSGTNPSVALNDSGQVVEVHQFERKLYYRLGTVVGQSVVWKPSHEYQSGDTPSVALNNDGILYEFHEGLYGTLSHIKGEIKNDKIEWASPTSFARGRTPACAANSSSALQAHGGNLEFNLDQLFYSTSLDTNRADWMAEQLSSYRDVTLSEIVLPAAHDAGMYTASLGGKAQDRTIYEQLSGGIRFFDLRPDRSLRIVHGVSDGPLVQDVLNDVKKFMAEGHRELVILKFSHYAGFDDNYYRKLVQLIVDTIGPYLLPKTWTGRLADAKLSSMIEQRGKVLVVCSNDYPVRIPENGIYTYRDWDSKDVSIADLTVYDVYTNTLEFKKMEGDQLSKFDRFDGKCESSTTPCDLFLFSWTLTPVSNVSDASNQCNPFLGEVSARLNVNSHGKIPNLLFVDFFENSRVTDIAITLNKKFLLSRAKGGKGPNRPNPYAPRP